MSQARLLTLLLIAALPAGFASLAQGFSERELLERGSPPEGGLVSTEGHCPYGHADLWFVPIQYGLPIITEESEERHRNLEYVRGGCIVSADSPTHTLLCRSCGHRLTEAEGGSWFRLSDDPESFEVGLDDSLSAFPVITRATSDSFSALHIEQRIQANRVIEESLSYWSNAPFEELESDILDFASWALPREVSRARFDDHGHDLHLSYSAPPFQGEITIGKAYVDHEDVAIRWVSHRRKRMPAETPSRSTP